MLSVASVWEIATKVRIGKLTFSAPVHDYLLEHLDRSVTDLLGITLLHATSIANLPLHDRDSFDRLIIAQAIVERIPIISADETFDAYPVTRI